MRHLFNITADIEIQKNGKNFLNKRKIELLRQIRLTGSILAASKKMKLSYQQAWTIIKEINAVSSVPVVIRKRGGANGGGAELTKYGFNLIEKYMIIERMHEECLFKLHEEMQSCFI